MRWIFILSLFYVSACSVPEREEITNCESSVIRGLNTPSTYKRIAADSIEISTENPPYQSVDIEYDAQNTYGALVREHQFCMYPVDKEGIRVDMVVDPLDTINDAQNHKGLFRPDAKLPTRAEARAQFQAHIDEIVNEAKADDPDKAAGAPANGENQSEVTEELDS